ncbi:complex I NDUFA9 subunit family protein [Fodinicurvata sp. EGI_FJ10296]|uniref:complex I NDUFA9 subunit family protein n=1 Tax=Fodinicurvata sp. EGI_FJ10296 TaxID=3231908 RepID=UPI003452DD56
MPTPASTHRVVTIFGGAGFLGRYIVRDLAKRGWRVRVATRDPDKALFLKPMGSVGQIVPLPANIRDDDSVAAVVDGSDFVINLVGILAPSGKQTFSAVHAEAPGRIARIAAEAGVKRLIQVSAIGASPDSPSDYARSKAAGEAAVLEGFPAATILRPSIVFGAEDGFFNRFANMTRFSPFLPLIGGGKTRFQPVYVGDVADAVMACLDRDDSQGKIFELGGPRSYTFRELMELMLKVIGRRRILLPLPWSVARIMGSIFERLPLKILTRDQVTQLQHDNVVSGALPTLADLGVETTALEGILPSYLDRYRIGGQFSRYRQGTPPTRPA